jgi:hypothetical protein
VFELAPEITNDTEFDGGIAKGLVKFKLLVRVILNVLALALRNVQNLPAFDVAVLGKDNALKPAFVK